MLNPCKPALYAGLTVWALALAPAWAQSEPVAAIDLTTPDAAIAVAVAEPVAPKERWQLNQGVPVHTQLQAWAERGGWTLDWQPKVTWLVAGNVGFEGSFEEALTEVIESLFFEGKPIRLVLWQGNRLAEVIPSDIR